MDFSAIRKEIFNNNLSVNELVTDFFSKIDSIDPEINSFTCVTKDLAEIQQAPKKEGRSMMMLLSPKKSS